VKNIKQKVLLKISVCTVSIQRMLLYIKNSLNIPAAAAFIKYLISTAVAMQFRTLSRINIIKRERLKE
jgi:hypothetical protein